jgi:hypothetical protein
MNVQLTENSAKLPEHISDAMNQDIMHVNAIINQHATITTLTDTPTHFPFKKKKKVN